MTRSRAGVLAVLAVLVAACTTTGGDPVPTLADADAEARRLTVTAMEASGLAREQFTARPTSGGLAACTDPWEPGDPLRVHYWVVARGLDDGARPARAAAAELRQDGVDLADEPLVAELTFQQRGAAGEHDVLVSATAQTMDIVVTSPCADTEDQRPGETPGVVPG